MEDIFKENKYQILMEIKNDWEIHFNKINPNEQEILKNLIKHIKINPFMIENSENNIQYFINFGTIPSRFIIFYQNDTIIGIKLNNDFNIPKPIIIDYLPEDFSKLKNLKYFICNHLKLSNFPNWLCYLEKLEYLDLIGNNFYKIPDSIGNLHNLTHLRISATPLKCISNNIRFLTNLKELYLSNLDLIEFQREFGEIKGLKSLTLKKIGKISKISFLFENMHELVKLELSGINIREIGDWIENVKQLEDLKIENCDIVKISRNLNFLNNLRYLRIIGNKNLISIPDLNNLKNLVELDLSSNNLDVFPNLSFHFESLKIIKCDNNNISMIPENIGNIHNLEYLSLKKNNIQNVPKSILNLKSIKMLNLDNNKIKIFDENIFQLESLNEIYLSNNNISEIQFETKDIKKFKAISIRDNPLSEKTRKKL